MKEKILKNLRRSLLLFTVIGVFNINLVKASESENGHEAASEEKFNASEMILHHIKDSHEWHFATIGHTHITLPLPIIIYSSQNGLIVFSSNNFHNSDKTYLGYKLEHEHIISENTEEKIFDFSVTKNVASLLLSAIILISVFMAVNASAQNTKGKAPKGLQAWFEPLVVFVRDEIAIPNIGQAKYEKYLPYLLTAFFFIWVNNLLGLLPQGANVTGNIAVTLSMALFTLVLTILSGNKDYWKHIFATPGVPTPLLIIMIPVEIIGIFTKPFALMIRLFANITAGHIIILSILSFIFIFKNIMVAAVSVPFAVVMSLMEVFVAALQAYIFTLLSALFIGQAVAEHEHHNDHH